jgi:hypothetical protein
VKGRGERGPVQFTENEWPSGINVRDQYRLYVVADCVTNACSAFKLAVKSRQSFTIYIGYIVREAEQD